MSEWSGETFGETPRTSLMSISPSTCSTKNERTSVSDGRTFASVSDEEYRVAVQPVENHSDKASSKGKTTRADAMLILPSFVIIIVVANVFFLDYDRFETMASQQR